MNINKEEINNISRNNNQYNIHIKHLRARITKDKKLDDKTVRKNGRGQIN